MQFGSCKETSPGFPHQSQGGLNMISVSQEIPVLGAQCAPPWATSLGNPGKQSQKKPWP